MLSDFAVQSNLQIIVILLTSCCIQLVLVVTRANSTKIFESLLRSTSILVSGLTTVIGSTLFLKINSSTLEVDNIPYWLNPWWVILEIFFVINFLLSMSLVCYQSCVSLGGSNYTVEINSDDFSERRLFGYHSIRTSTKISLINLLAWLIFSLITLVCSFLMFFLCNAGSC